jgi:hypothetical protein
MSVRANIPGSARVSGVGFGVSPKESFLDIFNSREVRESVTLLPTRETRALPRDSERATQV